MKTMCDFQRLEPNYKPLITILSTLLLIFGISSSTSAQPGLIITCPADTTVECTATAPSSTGYPSAQSLCAVFASDSLSGALTTDDQITNLFASNSGDCSISAADKYFDAWYFVVSATDTYTFTGNFSGDGMAAIYSGFFDHQNPCENFIDGDDDDGSGLNPLVIECLMTPGPYVLVSTSFGALSTQTYDWTFSSSAGGQIFSAIDFEYTDQEVRGACAGEGTIFRRWTASDDCGNEVSCTQTITVEDNTPPILSCPGDVTIACDEPLPPPAITVTEDGCFFPPAFCDQAQGQPGFPSDADCEAAVCAVDPFCCDVSWDGICAGEAATTPECCDCLEEPTCGDFCDQPQGSPGFPGDANCEAAICAADPFCCDVEWDAICAAAAADEPACCDCVVEPTCAEVPVSFVDSAPSGSCPAVVVRTYSAVDDCGNATSCTQRIFIEDTTPPTISCPADATVECDEPNDPGALGFATGTDNCGDVAIEFSDAFTPVCGTSGTISRTWTATDDCGNTSTCVQTIDVVDTTAPILFTPDDITVECPSDTDPSISGQGIAIDNCGTPTVSYTDFYCATEGFVDDYDPANWVINAPNGGSVIVNGGVELTSPNGTQCAGQSTTYSIVVPEDGKLIFSWDYVNSDIDGPFWDPFGYNLNGTFHQLTDDNGGDVQSGIGAVLVSAGDVFAFDALSRDCIFGSSATTVIDFFAFTCPDEPPPGVFWPTDIDRCWQAEDACGNVTLGIQHITIQDLELPNAICNQSMAVPVDAMGMTQIPAEAFNGGSSDNCGFVFFKVRRMDAPDGYDCFIPGNEQYQFDDYVKFCCDDIPNNEIMVVLRVYEHDPGPGVVSDTLLEGHWVECMVMVEVQDKIGPEIECPTDLTVSCEFPFDPDNLDVFGSVVTDPADREDICLDDPGNPNTNGLECVGLDGLATDNCSVVMEELPAIMVDSVCGTGQILRTFIATDNGGFTATCQQQILFINYDPLELSDISFPPDFHTTDICMVDQLDPEDLPAPFNEPVINSDQCDLVTFTYDDVVYDFSNTSEACFKILRTWSVIDWCQFESNNGQTTGLWTDVQVIKVQNTVPPTVLTRTPDQDVCTDDEACGPGSITLNASGTDDCTDEDILKWIIRVDWDDNGSFDDISPVVTGSSIEYNTTMPLGTHRVLFTLEDLCGNMTTEESFITMISCKTPSPVCQHVVTALTPMGNTAMSTIWASDLDASSYHDCGYSVDFAFDPQGLVKSMTFDCDDLGINEVQMYVIDENGLWDFCTVNVTVQDHNGICPDPGLTGTIAGMVESSGTLAMDDVMIQLHGSGLNPEYTAAGSYAFPSMPFGGSYTVEPVLNTNHKDGVSTIDLIKIQKHLLGIEQLDSPYKIIAADANRSGGISAVDILHLKKLILGLIDELPDNTSWRFVDAAYAFTNESDPLSEPFPEEYQINPFMTDMMDVDFVGIKVGDVNETTSQLTGNNEDDSERRDGIALMLRDIEMRPGEIHQVEVSARDLDAVGTMQFTLEWDPALIRVHGVYAGERTTDEQWNATRLDEGVLPFSWHALEVPGSGNDELVTLRVEALENVRLSDVLSLGSRVTPEEASLANGRLKPLKLAFEGQTSDDGSLVVHQNIPNPFASSTIVPFEVTESGVVKLQIYNALGVLLHSQEQEATTGYNEFRVEADDLAATGFLLYSIETTTAQATNRMLIVSE